MRVGVPREVKNQEHRVAITPAGVQELVGRGHRVLVQAGAGRGSSIPDDDFAAAGADVVPEAEAVWDGADLLLKVKEPVGAEHALLRRDQVLFTYLHLAADEPLTRALVGSGATALAYETVALPDRSLPLLAPMSEVAGALAPQVGAAALMRAGGGRGVLMGGVPGVRAARVVVVGAGVAGMSATAVALGMGADVVLLDRDVARLRAAGHLGGRLQTVASSDHEVERAVLEADLVIGAVLVPGARAPRLVSNDLVARMRPGSVLVDLSVDQGGCFADTRATTHDDPTYRVHGSVFYAVANMPGAVPRTSTWALTNATLPYVLALAERGWRGALAADPALAAGLNAHDGAVTHPGVAAAHDLAHTPVEQVLA